MSKLILYSYYRSSSAYRVRIALGLKKLSYEYRAVHLLKNGGEQHSSSYRILNPAEQVPTLVDGDFVLSESMAILDYLENTHPVPELLPKEAKTRAQIIRFCEVINAGIQPLGNLKVTQELEKHFPGSSDLRQQWIQRWVTPGLHILEKLLAQYAGTYAFGGQVTWADILLVPQVYSAQRFKVDLTPFSNIQRVFSNCEKLPEFIAAHPSRQPDNE